MSAQHYNYNNWQDQGACRDSSLDFYTDEAAERYECRAVCHNCAVRFQCLQGALNRNELFGIWGGVDEYELRRAMSVNARGEAMERAHAPRCPYCKGRKLTELSKSRDTRRVQCDGCKLEWNVANVRKPRTAKPKEASKADDEDE